MIKSLIEQSKIISNYERREIYGNLCRLVKTLMMSELEIVYFASLLEKIGWETKGLCLYHHLLIGALIIKVLFINNRNMLEIIARL
jgi:hypothetical protein